ncbi:LysM peptidoglycan-binding domain-containing protein [Opitutales bacterium]|jgi:tetratricopeptide (TPR) repeat protein|nr:LysM peptidoglycan-binding domain-containing protein [Opitutales bacterium]
MPAFLKLILKFRPVSEILVASLIVMAGCVQPKGEELSEREISSFRTGESYLSQGRHDQALSAFLKVVEMTPIAPESHLYLGQLYLEHTKDPVLAIYHFGQYLKFNPTSRQAPMVRELINTAKKEFARTFPADLFNAELERMDMLAVIEQKDAEILSLKKELARLQAEQNSLNLRLQEMQSRTPSYTAPEAPVVTQQQRRVQPLPRSNLLGGQTNAPATASGSERIHVVKPGDNLGIISREYYGDSSRIFDIYEANRDIIPNVNTISEGQRLKIPD